MASVSSDDRNDTACDKCGAPASWVDTIPGNLSWKQSLKHHLDTYFASPRMWPIGYIIQSSYSPFRLELEMPDHHGNWRDAFEDLLALESGGQMISLESRKKEAEVAKRLWHDSVSLRVSFINDRLKSDARTMSLLQRARDLATRGNWAEPLEEVGKAIPAQEEYSKKLVADGKGWIANLEEQMGISRPASSYKMRGQWMASLVSSGALPRWLAQISESSEGFQVALSKYQEGPDDADSQSMTEMELKKQFEEGIPIQLGSPSWSTDAGHYPEPDMLREEVMDGGNIGYVKLQPFRLRPSILSQVISAECAQSEKSKVSTKVHLKTLFTDGTTDDQEIVDDASRVLEETDKVYNSMQARSASLGLALQEVEYDRIARSLQANEEIDELD